MESRPCARLSRRDLLKLGGAAAAATAVTLRRGESFADGDPPPANAPKPTRGGTFRIRIGQTRANFDPRQPGGYSTIGPLSCAYSWLVMSKPCSSVVSGT